MTYRLDVLHRSVRAASPMTPPNHHEPWSLEDEKQLSWDWGTVSLTRLALELGRTPLAVWRKADALGLGRANRGGMSLTALARYSGFDIHRIQKAAKVLGIHLRHGLASEPGAKYDRTRTRSIGDEQQEQLIEFMLRTPFIFADESPDAKHTRAGVWGVGKKPAACLRCERTDKPHFAKGFCRSCYNTRYRKYVASGNPSKAYFDDPVLTAEQVVAIRTERAEEKTSYRKLAKKYGVASPTIVRAVKGQSWKHAGGPIDESPSGGPNRA